MKKLSIPLSFIFFFYFNSSFSQMDKLEIENFDIVSMGIGEAFVLPHAARCAHSALNFHKKLFDYEPRDKIHVMIQDFGDYGNGGATSIPNNMVSTCISPMNYSFESSIAGERVFAIMNHELVHIVALDNYSKTDVFYRKLFAGKVRNTNDHPVSMFYSYLTNPRYYSPRWFHEGIAVFIETWMDGGKGNALGSYDEMFFRTRTLENSRIYSAQGLESEGTSADFMSKANSYYYGTRFMSYVAHQYGPTNLIEWIKRKDQSKRGFASNFKNVFGLSISKAWDTWIDFERSFQDENINRLKKFPITQYEPITEKVLGGVSHAFHDKKRNKIYVAVNYPGKVPHIASIDLETGEIDRLKDVKGPALFNVASLTYDEKNDLLIYSTDNNANRDLNSYNLKTGETKLLQKNEHIGDLAFNKKDESLWGIRHLNGYNTIVKIPKYNSESPNDYYTNWNQKYTLPFGHDIFDIDISPDGKSLSAAVADYFGNQYLHIYDIESFDKGGKEDIVYKEVFNFDVSSPQSFRYTEDGNYLFGSSYYTGVSNIWRVDANTYQADDIDLMSNAVTGYFRPIQIDKDRIFAFRYTSDGFLPVYIPNNTVLEIETIKYLGNETIKKHPELKEWRNELPTPQTVNLDEITIEKNGVYLPRKEMKLNYAYPIVVGYKDNIGIGYKFNFEDPFSFRSFDLSFSFTPKQWKNQLSDGNATIDDDEQFHGSLNFSTSKIGGFLSGSYDFFAHYNKDNFYDLFGPTKRSRKGLLFGFNNKKSLIWDNPKNLDLTTGFRGFYGLDQSPDFQQIDNFDKDYDTNLFYDIFSSLTYRNIRRSVGAVDGEKGVNMSLNASSSISEGNFYPTFTGNFDFGIQLPVNHTSLWFRTSSGNSFSKKVNPFTRFGFAAFGNNYIDYLSSKRYRGIYSFPGVSFDSGRNIIAKNFFKTTAELLLPPLRYRKVGFFNFFASWSHPTIFAGFLTAKDINISGNDVNQNFYNIGFQLDTRLVMFSHLAATLSVGWAKAYDLDDSSLTYDEWMVSLKF